MKLDSSIAAPILIGSVLAASPPELSPPPPASVDSLVSEDSVDSLLELEPPPPQAASATLIAKTKSIKPSFKNGDLKVFSSC